MQKLLRDFGMPLWSVIPNVHEMVKHKLNSKCRKYRKGSKVCLTILKTLDTLGLRIVMNPLLTFVTFRAFKTF